MDRDDDILDIDLDDLDPAEPLDAATVSGPASSPDGRGDQSGKSPTAPPRSEGRISPSAGIPMVRAGTCPHCGFALRPLEEICPRCHQDPSRQPEPIPIPEKPVPVSAGGESVPQPDFSPAPPASRRRVSAVLVSLIAMALLLGLSISLFYFSPAVQARLAYRRGLRLQMEAQFEAARQEYQRCLECDPHFGLAAFSIGTTYLRLGDPGIIGAMQDLTSAATKGDTSALDEADRWFGESIRIAQELPVSQRLSDARISTPRKLIAFAHSCLALTALVRASAAMQADQLEDGLAWLQRAGEEAQAALTNDPGNSAADRILRAVTPRL